MKQSCSNGGQINRRKISTLSELTDYDIIINCTGLGARHLVNDPLVYPIQGQTVAVNQSRVFMNITINHHPLLYLIVIVFCLVELMLRTVGLSNLIQT